MGGRIISGHNDGLALFQSGELPETQAKANIMWDAQIIITVLAVSGLVGFLAGLLGIGGGMIMVPVILWVLHVQGLDSPHAQHIAVGTSFLVMVFTSFSSALAQHLKGAVRWDIVKRIVPAIMGGVLLGAVLARYIPSRGLQLFFIAFAFVAGIQTLLRMKPKPSRNLPKSAGMTACGGFIGVISSWVGIGGGALSMPFMLYCNVPVRETVGTSAALGWPIALTGALGYLLSGWMLPGLPAGSVGFWYLPLALIMALGTVAVAPLGVKVAHKLAPEKLKTALGVLLLVIALQMLSKWLAV